MKAQKVSRTQIKPKKSTQDIKFEETSFSFLLYKVHANGICQLPLFAYRCFLINNNNKQHFETDNNV